MKKNWKLSRYLIWIFFTAVAFNTLAYLGVQGYRFFEKKRSQDFKVPIKAIVQTGPQKEALKTPYLAELLDLCSDRPMFSSELDPKEAQKKLLGSPVIKEAQAKVKEPGILYIDYTTRRPLAFLLDYENVALDAEGYPFPVMPFFTPKKLPEIYLGMETLIEWNQPISGEKIELAFELLKILKGPIVSDLFNIQRIDVSNAFQKSLGRREIVLIVHDEIYHQKGGREVLFVFPRILRLTTKNYAQELSNYLKLHEQLLEKEKTQLERCVEADQSIVFAPKKIIDFRVRQLAFIDED